jgi:MFS family permease
MEKSGERFQFVNIIGKPWYRWIVYLIAITAFTLAVMLTSISVIIPDLMRDLKINADNIGVLSAIYALIYAFMQIPGGSLADRIGPRKVITIFLILGGFGILLFSWAPNYGVGIAGRVLTAFGVGVLYVNQIKLIRGWFSTNEMGTVMGIGSSIQAVGLLFATPLLAFLSLRIGWRFTYSIIGGMVILFSFLSWFFIRDVSPNQADTAVFEKPGFKFQVENFFKLMKKDPRFIKLFMITFFAYGGITVVFHTWGIPFLMQAFNYPKMQAAWMMSLSSLTSLMSAPLIGYLSDKVIQKRMPLVIFGLIGITIPMVLIASLGTKIGTVGLAIAFGLVGFSISGVLLAYTMINEMVPPFMSGLFSAFLNMGPYLGNSLFMLITGLLLGKTFITSADGTPLYSIEKYQNVFLLSAIIGIVALIIAFMVREIKNKTSHENPT